MMRKQSAEAGFTLIEVMISVLCVAILAAIAVPKVSGYLRQARLDSAKPYLLQIAAKQRMFKVENGYYCCSAANSGLNENTLTTNLGVVLADIGDYCFVFICQSTTLCQSTSGPGFITTTSGPNAPDFEVWAILQDASGGVDAGPGGVACTLATNKVAATGWVASSTSTAAGRGGQVVVLRYPPPANGAGTTGAFSPHTGLTFTWTDGISITDAMFP